MPKTSQLETMTIVGMAVRSLCEQRPSISLDDAAPALERLIVIASYEATDTGTLQQRAAAALANPRVQELLPPWA